MKNTNIKKINVLGKVGKILSIILIVITSVGMACMIALSIGAMMLPEDFLKIDGKWNCTSVTDCSSKLVEKPDTDEDYKDYVSIHGINIGSYSKSTEDAGNSDIVTTISETTVNGTVSKPLKTIMLAVSIFVMVMLIFLDISLHFAKTLCKSLEKCETPFSVEVVEKMKKFAISLIPFGIFCVGAGGVSAVGIAFIVIVVLLFSAIFGYGAELQRESDETL